MEQTYGYNRISDGQFYDPRRQHGGTAMLLIGVGTASYLHLKGSRSKQRCLPKYAVLKFCSAPKSAIV